MVSADAAIGERAVAETRTAAKTVLLIRDTDVSLTLFTGNTPQRLIRTSQRSALISCCLRTALRKCRSAAILEAEKQHDNTMAASQIHSEHKGFHTFEAR